MAFVNKAFYRGKVTRQELVSSREGYPVFQIGVKLEGQLVDSRRPNAGLTACDQVEVEASLRFPTDNEQVLGFAVGDLLDMGYEDPDLSRLSPSHPKHHSFVGQTIHVCPTVREYNGTSSTFWNLRFPKQREDKPLNAAEVKDSAAAQAYRELLARKKKERLGQSQDSGEAPPF